MGIKVMLSGICVAGLLAPAVLAQTPAPAPRARTAATRHVMVQHAGSSYLGVGVVEITPDRAKELHLKDERGVEVRCVDEDSPAAKAGLKEGDVVLEYNGQHVEGGEQFIRLVRETPPGRSANLVIWRNGATQTLTASIGQRRAPMAFEFDFDELANAFPKVAPMPPTPSFHMPDLPSTFMTWHSSTLGIESESLNHQLAQYFGVKEGVLVRSVVHDSSAEKAGFKAGDVIIKVDGQKVTTPREISSILQSSRAKKSLPVTVLRREKELVLNVLLEENSRWPAFETREML